MYMLFRVLQRQRRWTALDIDSQRYASYMLVWYRTYIMHVPPNITGVRAISPSLNAVSFYSVIRVHLYIGGEVDGVVFCCQTNKLLITYERTRDSSHVTVTHMHLYTLLHSVIGNT